MTTADRIKELRNKRGWSQEELAKRCGYNGKSSISRVEASGDNVSLNKVKLFADIFRVSPAYLMGWEDNLEDETNPDMIVDLLSDPELIEYVKKIQSLKQEDREMVYAMIDRFCK